MNLPWVSFISKDDFLKYSIREIKIYHYLSDDEKQRLPVTENIYSKLGIYVYDEKGNLTSVNYYLSGVDSAGTDHLPENRKKWLINGKNITYDKHFRKQKLRTFGAGIESDADYYYDEKGKLQMVQLLKKSGNSVTASLAGRVLYDYFPGSGLLKYKVELNEFSQPVKNYFYIYNDFKLQGVSAEPEGIELMTYSPYKDLGNINAHTIYIDDLRIERFMMLKMKTRKLMALIQMDDEDYIYFNISR